MGRVSTLTNYGGIKPNGVRATPTNPAISVSEVFGPVIQGEGPVLGRPTVFVRTGGCPFRCSWCDSLHAVLPEHRSEWRLQTAEEIAQRIRSLSADPIMVTLSGGDPAMQPLEPLIDYGHSIGDTFCLECEGWIARPWFAKADWAVFSPKPPSSGMPQIHPTWPIRLQACIDAAAAGNRLPGRLALKVPIFDDRDLGWVETEVLRRWPHLPLYLSVGNPHPPADEYARGEMAEGRPQAHSRDWLAGELLARYEWLCNAVLTRGLPVICVPQVHVLVYGNERQR